ncbi:GAF domain-containing protein, partial [Streptomyces sp. NRRL F-3273]|uniref:GAF domain-containing protein n=1 Tax=Streptomyces sp. NRRL F-3273 TaxID=1463848 RepID=UPI00051784FB
LHPLGSVIRFLPSTDIGAGLLRGRSVLDTDLASRSGWQQQDPERAERMVECGFHSLIAVPIRARGVVLGVAMFWRAQRPEPFEDEDLSVAEEIVARAAVKY